MKWADTDWPAVLPY